jgi:2-oxoglutarate dehydrogenase E1 component
VIGDAVVQDPKKVKRVVLCAGQVYYDLAAGRKEKGVEDESPSCVSSSCIPSRPSR